MNKVFLCGQCTKEIKWQELKRCSNCASMKFLCPTCYDAHLINYHEEDNKSDDIEIISSYDNNLTTSKKFKSYFNNDKFYHCIEIVNVCIFLYLVFFKIEKFPKRKKYIKSFSHLLKC